MVRLLSNLSADRFDVTVVSIADRPADVRPLLPDHVTVCDLRIGESPPSLRNLARLPRIVRSTDVMVCSLFHATFVGVTLGVLFSVPVTLVWQHNSEYSSRLRRRLYSWFYSRSNRVLADSEAVKEMLVTDQHVARKDIAVLPIAGVDTERFRPTTDRTTEDRVAVGTIGRLIDRKGYPELFTSAERLGDRFQFYVIGKGPAFERYERVAPDNVQLLGPLDDDELPERLGSFDVYFQPSHFEGLCMTVIEAMACGLPVVASSVGGITESVVDGTTGYLCKPKDVDCFCERLSYLADHPDEAAEMGRLGRTRVKDRYSANVLSTEFENVVDDVPGVD
jgi:glycosyltransferase involved in cell wall biosynthesis